MIRASFEVFDICINYYFFNIIYLLFFSNFFIVFLNH
jgi:hypothetical protein